MDYQTLGLIEQATENYRINQLNTHLSSLIEADPIDADEFLEIVFDNGTYECGGKSHGWDNITEHLYSTIEFCDRLDDLMRSAALDMPGNAHNGADAHDRLVTLMDAVGRDYYEKEVV